MNFPIEKRHWVAIRRRVAVGTEFPSGRAVNRQVLPLTTRRAIARACRVAGCRMTIVNAAPAARLKASANLRRSCCEMLNC